MRASRPRPPPRVEPSPPESPQLRGHEPSPCTGSGARRLPRVRQRTGEDRSGLAVSRKGPVRAHSRRRGPGTGTPYDRSSPAPFAHCAPVHGRDAPSGRPGAVHQCRCPRLPLARTAFLRSPVPGPAAQRPRRQDGITRPPFPGGRVRTGIGSDAVDGVGTRPGHAHPPTSRPFPSHSPPKHRLSGDTARRQHLVTGGFPFPRILRFPGPLSLAPQTVLPHTPLFRRPCDTGMGR